MGLYERLKPETTAELIALGSSHMAATHFGQRMRESARRTARTVAQIRAQIIAFYSFDAGEIVELDVVLALIDGEASAPLRVAKAIEIEDVLNLSIGGAAYETRAKIRSRLGV